jgi:hypothetical protein
MMLRRVPESPRRFCSLDGMFVNRFVLRLLSSFIGFEEISWSVVPEACSVSAAWRIVLCL